MDASTVSLGSPGRMTRASDRPRPLRLALLTTDAREHYGHYDRDQPYFGTAPAALLSGLARLPDQLEVHVVSCTQRRVSAPEKLDQNVWFHSLLVPNVGWMRTGYQGCVRAVRRKLRQIGPELVHAQGTERDCGICGVFSGFPNLLTLHGNMRNIARMNHARPFSFLWLSARLEGLAVRRCGGVVCISTHAEQLVAGQARHSWVVPNAADLRFFEARPEPGPQVELLCVGTVCNLKNQNRLIEALDPIAADRSFTLRFLGRLDPRDPYAQTFERLVERRTWCRYDGFVERDDLLSALRRAALLVHPSYEENCPMAIIEAMAVGIPVVAARRGGVPDIIEEGRTGLLFDPLDDGGIRDAVVRVLDDDRFVKSVIAAAGTRARARYHPDAVAARHMEIYAEAVERSAGNKA